MNRHSVLFHLKFNGVFYEYCGQTTSGHISQGHVCLPSVGQHSDVQFLIGGIPPLPAIPFNCTLESFLLRKFFML